LARQHRAARQPHARCEIGFQDPRESPLDGGAVKHLQKKSLAGKIALDLIVSVALATAMGIVAGVALAGVTLLFASQAKAAEASQQGRLLLRPRAAGEERSAPLLSTAVVFRISGMVARARVVQTFRNPSDKRADGLYVFPLPENAAFDRLKVRVGAHLATDVIESQAAPLVARVPDIGAGEPIVVEIEYQQTLRAPAGAAPLREPTIVAPRADRVAM
jgi:Ca-activated chloride channel family protein